MARARKSAGKTKKVNLAVSKGAAAVVKGGVLRITNVRANADAVARLVGRGNPGPW